MLNFILFLLSPLLALTGMSNINQPTPPPTQQQNYASTTSCWDPEPSVNISVSEANLDSVHNSSPAYASQPPCHGPGTPFTPTGGGDGLIGTYVRVRQNVRLINLKVDEEGKPFYGGCGLSGSAIRWVGNSSLGRIFWEDANFNQEKMFDFIFIEAYPADSQAHYFDVYARQSIIADPTAAGYGFVLECKTTGGLVPVSEVNADELPPQVVSFKEINKTGYEANYNQFAIPINVTQKPGIIGPTLPPSYQLFPPYMNYLIKVDKSTVPSPAIPKGQIGKVVRTVSGITHIYDVYYHAGAFYLSDEGDKSAYIYDASDTAPPTGLTRNPSLQLGVLAFRLVNEFGPYTPVCKPAIYLYPTKPTQLSVKLNLDGKLTQSIPAYDSNKGWSVTANPDGVIENSTINYPYLYYEANINNLTIPKEGWVIRKEELGGFFDNTLAQLGLNLKESSDFKDYWLNKLTDKSYYFITLLPSFEVNQKEKLVFSQNPDTLIRVRFMFEGLNAPKSVKPLVLSEIPKRAGFTAVDWGGGIIGGSCDGGNFIIK